MKKYLKPSIFVISAEIIGSIGTIATSPAIPDWYQSLEKPALNPPNWIFGSVWTILFALMGYSAYLIYKKGLKKRNVKIALTVFGIQFILNITWSFIFFGANLLFTAFAEIILLWITIVITIYKFYKIDKTAGLLLLPYLLWVTFATYLNLSIAVLNRF